jgi:phospholipase C
MMPNIEHVVLLMLENRSFDTMLGALAPQSDAFDGLSGCEANPYHPPGQPRRAISVWNDPEMTPRTACIPDPDPGETFFDIQMQMNGLGGTPAATPAMTGFVDNYMLQPPSGTTARGPESVMHYFTPKQVPVISALARAFGVSDRWHASAPCQTWPNRFFVHTGTAGGWVNNQPYHLFRAPTIQRRLEACGHSWRIYFHDVPQSASLRDLWPRLLTHFHLFADFQRDAREGRLPSYSFLEPRYFASRWRRLMPNDQHPPHSVVYGEQLIADTYNALRSSPSWEKTLLILTYDEHGGCYDHVPPPSAASPGGPFPDGFAFDRYGPRVPAVLVSPCIPAGSVIRPPVAPPGVMPAPFDHATVLATLTRLFALGAPLTARVAAAPDLLGALSETPDNPGPARIEPPRPVPSPAELRRALGETNALQQSLHRGAAMPGYAARAAAHLRRRAGRP